MTTNKTRFLRYILPFLASFFGSAYLNAQVIEASPVYPTVSDSVDITFYADRCECPFEDYTGDIYAHTGVLTTESANPSEWKYVIAGWNENLEKAQLERIAENQYVLHITPSISEYYNLPSNVSVTDLAFVFRNAEGSAKTIDLFYEVQDEGLTVKFNKPLADTVVQSEASFTVKASTIRLNTPPVDSLMLFVDNTLKTVVYDSILTYNLDVETEGIHWIKLVAENPEFSVADSISYFIRNEINIAEIPGGSSNGINIINDNTVTFVLYAPNKNNVFLLGDFNDWELSNDYLMNQTPDGKRYWTTISDLTAGEEYAFQYLIDGTIRVGDAYAEKILDPANDPGIPDNTYPNLKPYPEGKTTGIVSVFQTVQDVYEWQTSSFAPPSVTDLVIYELHIQNFTSKKNVKGLTDTLDYLSELGVNAIELMPVNEFEGNQSWGYNPSFYFALDKVYGTKNDFKAFVDACHSKGIAVLIDMVLNHSYGQSPLVQMYWNHNAGKPAADNPWYNEEHNYVDNGTARWGNDFNHESQATQDLIDSINSFWMSEYRIDGFRFDFTKGFTNTLWYGEDNWGGTYDADRITHLKRMTDEIWLRNENAYVILEHFADNSEEKELSDYGLMIWGNGNYNANEATMGYTENGKSDFNWGSYKNRGWTDPHLVLYMESHDEERLMYKNQRWGNENAGYSAKELRVALLRAEAAAAFFFTIPGPRMIWMWGELGYDYSINRCADGTVDDGGGCRLTPKPLGWDFYDEPMRYRLHEVYKALIDFKQMDICRTTDFTMNTYSALKKMSLNSPEMNATILGNFDIVKDDINPGFQHTGTWYDYLTGESIEVADINDPIQLGPGEYKIYTDVALETPDLPVSIHRNSMISNNSEPFIFPNPAGNSLNILSNSTGDAGFAIYNLSGQLVQSINYIAESGIPHEIDLNLEPGIYIYKMRTQDTNMQGKLVIE